MSYPRVSKIKLSWTCVSVLLCIKWFWLIKVSFENLSRCMLLRYSVQIFWISKIKLRTCKSVSSNLINMRATLQEERGALLQQTIRHHRQAMLLKLGQFCWGIPTVAFFSLNTLRWRKSPCMLLLKLLSLISWYNNSVAWTFP